MNPDMVYTYTKDLIERLSGQTPQIDPDGDLHFRHLDAGFFARVHPQAPVVQVFTVAVAQPQESEELFRAINLINTQLIFARALYVEGQVLIEKDIYASDLSPALFDAACRLVATATDTFAGDLQQSVHGQLMFDFDKGEQYDPQVVHQVPTTGFYL